MPMKLYQRWKNTAIHNKALVWTGVLVAVGTIFYALAAIFQIYLMKATAEETSKQAERLIVEMGKQSNAMQNAANLAEHNIKATQEQFRDEQRAWLNITSVNWQQFDASKILKIEVNIKNSGKTPAINTTFHYKIWDRVVGKKKLIGEGEERGVNYGPGDEKRETIRIFFKNSPEQLIQQLQSGGIILYAEIVIKYCDIYNKKKLHTTCATFCADARVMNGLSWVHCEPGCAGMD